MGSAPYSCRCRTTARAARSDHQDAAKRTLLPNSGCTFRGVNRCATSPAGPSAFCRPDDPSSRPVTDYQARHETDVEIQKAEAQHEATVACELSHACQLAAQVWRGSGTAVGLLRRSQRQTSLGSLLRLALIAAVNRIPDSIRVVGPRPIGRLRDPLADWLRRIRCRIRDHCDQADRHQ